MSDLENIAKTLRQTTELMANDAKVDMSLWNEHSNACLRAADALTRAEALIEELAGALGAMTPKVRQEELRGLILRDGTFHLMGDDVRAARAALASYEA